MIKSSPIIGATTIFLFYAMMILSQRDNRFRLEANMKSIITGSEWLYYQGDCQHNAVEISAEKQFHDAVGGRSYFSFEQIQ